MALAGFGTKLKMGDGAETPTYAEIAGVTNISGPSFSVDTEDVTDMDSTNGWEEHIPTIKRSGEVALDIHFEPTETTHTDVTSALGEQRSFQLVFPDDSSTQWDFDAIITGFETEEPYDGKISGSINLKITGEPTLA